MFFSDDEIEEMLNNIFNSDEKDIDPISLSEEEDMDYVKKNLQRSLGIRCECGSEKTYGQNTNIHSDYCPKSKIK